MNIFLCQMIQNRPKNYEHNTNECIKIKSVCYSANPEYNA